MRYDTPVYFQRITPGEYDPNTGNYGDDTVEETLRYASVMNTGEERLKAGEPYNPAPDTLHRAV